MRIEYGFNTFFNPFLVSTIFQRFLKPRANFQRRYVPLLTVVEAGPKTWRSSAETIEWVYLSFSDFVQALKRPLMFY